MNRCSNLSLQATLIFVMLASCSCLLQPQETAKNALAIPQAENSSTQASPSPAPTGNEGSDQKNSSGFVFQSYDGKSWQIVYIKEDGSGRRSLTEQIADDLQPAWSPDGTKVAFAMRYKGIRQIFTVGIDGSNLRRATDSLVDLYSPAWSPDGRKIAFVTELSIPERSFETCVYPSTSIFIMNADGTAILNLTASHNEIGDCINVAPVWSPDSRQLAFSSFKINIQSKQYYASLLYNFWSATEYPDIYTIREDGTGLANITRTKLYSEISPAWSPDGSKIIFIANREGGNWMEDEWQVYIYSTATGESARLGTTNLKWNIIGMSRNFGEKVISYAPGSFGPYISWSPDGKKLSTQVFGQLVIADAQSGEITGEYPGISRFYCWSRHSNRIAYIPASTVLNSTCGDLLLLNIDGSGNRTLEGTAASGYLSWHSD